MPVRRTSYYHGRALYFLVFAGALIAVRLRADVRLNLMAGIDGGYRISAWNPMYVNIAGAAQDKASKIQVTVRTQGGTQVYSRPVRLRASAGSQTITVTYFHPPLAQPKDISVQVVSDGRYLADRVLDSGTSIPEHQIAIVALTQDQSGLNNLIKIPIGIDHVSGDPNQSPTSFNNFGTTPNGSFTGNKVLYPKINSLPDASHGYDGIDAIVLGDDPLDSFTEDQWSAVVGWVRAGGLLIISGGADANRLRSSQLSGISPIEKARATQANISAALEARYGSAPNAKTSTVLIGSTKSDTFILCGNRELPLVMDRRVGAGHVILTAFDLMAPEFRSWNGQGRFWMDIVKTGRAGTHAIQTVRNAVQPSKFMMNRFGGNSGNQGRITDALAGVQATEAPSFVSIGIFLGIYILVLIPVNFLILRWMDRRELAWITMPIIIVAFSVAAYVFGYRLKGGNLYLRSFTVLEGSAGQDAVSAYTVASVFSPRQNRYDLSVNDASAVVSEVTEGSGGFQGSATDLSAERDQKSVTKGALINMWDHRAFDFEGSASLGGAVKVDFRKTSDTTGVATVVNGTPYTLNEGALSFRGNQVILGSLAPGASQSMKMNVGSGNSNSGISAISVGQSTPTVTMRQVREQLCATLTSVQSPSELQNDSPQFVFSGWIKESVVGLTLEGDKAITEQISLLVLNIPSPVIYHVQPAPKMPVVNVQPQNNPRIFSGNTGQLALNPTSSNFNNLAYQYARQGKLDEALTAAKQALAAAPNDPTILDTVGEMYQRKKEYESATKYYKLALGNNRGQKLTETECKFGQTLLAKGNKTEAIKHFSKAAEDLSDRYGQVARTELANLKIKVASNPQPRGQDVVLAAGQNIPPIPNTSTGKRRVIIPVKGGSQVNTQSWRTVGGIKITDDLGTVFVPDGKPIPK